MDRTLAYPSQQPTDTLWLNAERNKMIALGYLAQGVLGLSTVVDGLGCTPTTPASLAVNIGPGAIYSQEPLDSVAYGSLGVDTVDQIVKQGVIMPITALTLTPPTTSGQAINYLIEAELSEVDNNTAVLSYFNSASPTIPFTGPGGSGSSQPQTRQCTVNLVAKAGPAATAGSQITPSPDAGYVGLWVVTVANGATQITSAQISQYSAAPFISVKLPQVPGWVQGGTWAWATDTGSANAIAVTLNPVPATINAGFEVWFKKAVVSSGTVAISVNGASNVAVVNIDGSALSSTVTMNAGVLIGLKFDGTSWRWLNPQTSTAVGSLTAQNGEGITVNGTTAAVSLDYPGLTTLSTVASADLWAFYSQSATHHRVMSWAQLLAAIVAGVPVATTTSNGIAREATTAEAQAGATSGSVPAFVTPEGLAARQPFSKFFQSAVNAPSLPGGAISVAHGLGGVPKGFSVFLQNVNAEYGYQPGDCIALPNYSYPGGSYTTISGGDIYTAPSGNCQWANATNVGIAYNEFGGANNRLTGAFIIITPANWSLVFTAWL